MRDAFRPLLALAGILLGLHPLVGCRSTAEGPDGASPADWSLEIRGNKTFGTHEIKKWIADELSDFERGGFPKWAIDDAAFVVETRYRDVGFPLVEVEYDYSGPEARPIRPVLEVREGRRTVLRKVSFSGNRSFRSSELRPFFEGPRAGMLATGKPYFVRSKVADGARSVEGLYREHGFPEAQVSPPEITLDASRRQANVRVQIDEGRRHRLREITLAGELPLPAAELHAAVAGRLGEPFFDRLPYEIRARLEDELTNRGYADAEVEMAVVLDDDPSAAEVAVRLTCTITAGPLVRVGKIVVHGNEKTRAGFVRSRIELEPGETWSREAEEKSFRSLYGSGLFRRITMELEGEGTVRDLVVSLEEAPAGELYIEPGYGSYERLRVRVGYRQGNLFGTGRIFEARATLGPRARRGEVSLTDPWFLGSEYSATLSSFVGERDEPSFTSIESGTGLSFARQWTQRFKTTLGYEYGQSDTRDVVIVTPESEDLEQRLDLSAISFTPAWDNRNDFLMPSAGTLLKPTIEWSSSALGSEIDFVRLLYTQTHFFELTEGRVLGLSGSTGLVWNSEEFLPLQERFFNGGENTVRSFQEKELGPKDTNGNPVGGETFSVFTLELRQRLGGRLAGATFFDIGNVTLNTQDYLRFPNTRAGVGVGLHYLLPVGPVRLDFAVNPDPNDDEDDWALHLSIGMSF